MPTFVMPYVRPAIKYVISTEAAHAFVSSAVEKSASLLNFSSATSHLPLPVPAVILSAAKDPEELTTQNHLYLSTRTLPRICSCLFLFQKRHFDRSCSRPCEQLSGEICFSIATPQPAKLSQSSSQ
jgi:hypothetical protein